MTIARRINFILFSVLYCLASTAAAQNTILSGQLKGLSDGTITIFYNKGDVSKTDTVKGTGDHFTWSIDLDEPVRVALTAGRNNYFFFAEPGHLKLTGIKDSTSTYILSGAPMQHDAELFSAFTRDLTDERNLLFSKLQKASGDEKAEIQKKRENLHIKTIDRIAQFIADHPKSSYSVYLVSVERDYQVIKRLYNELDDAAKKTVVALRIARRLKVLEEYQIGARVTDFTQTDINGKKVALSNFKGKYVLLDFWASWCMPCRAENPNVLRAYNEFKEKGFTVIGISLDDKAANWKKAVSDDKMPWTQVSDLKGFNNDLAVRFGIQAIPSNFLIDPSGKIVAKDLRGDALKAKLKELLN